MKNHSAADGEDADGGQGEDLGDFWSELEEIGEQRAESAEDSERIEPDRSVNRVLLIAVSKTELHKDGGESDGSDDHNRERAVEGAASGEDDDEGEGSA